MRRLLLLPLFLAGCGAAAPTIATGVEPLPFSAVEETLTIDTLPGRLPAEWPLALAEAGGRYLLPFRDAHGLHARLVGESELDVDLRDGEWVGAAAHGDGFVVVTRDAEALQVQFLKEARTFPVALAGASVPMVASDGTRVLVATVTHVGASWLGHGALVGPDGVQLVELGAFSMPPSLFGDVEGFVVGGTRLVASDGTLTAAPAPQAAGARLFLRSERAGDSVTFDGSRWLGLDKQLAWATRDRLGASLGLAGSDGRDGHEVLYVGADLTPASAPIAVPRGAQPSWMRGFRGARALWETVIDSDHLFAILDRESLAPAGPLTRVPAPFSRSVVAALGESSVLLAWTGSGGECRYARWRR